MDEETIPTNKAKKWDLGNNHLHKGKLASGPCLNAREGLLEHSCTHAFLCRVGAAWYSQGAWWRVCPAGSDVHHLAIHRKVANPWSRSHDNPLLKMSRKAESRYTFDVHVGWYTQLLWEGGIMRSAQALGPFFPWDSLWGWAPGLEAAEVQPRLIQGIRRGDSFGKFTGYTGFNQILIRDIKSNRIRIAQ